MIAARTIGRFVLLAALVLSCAWAQAMDLRDMPDWVRDRIWPVEIDWQAMGAFGLAPPTPTPVNLGAPTVTTPGGETVTVGAPGLATGGGVTVEAPGFATGGGVHVPGFAGDAAGATGVRPATADAAPTLGGGVHVPGMGEVGMAGGVGVRLPGLAEVGVTGGVHVEAMGAEWDEALASIEGLDRETLAQAGQILAMIREQNMSPEQFAAWAKEHEVTPEVLTAGLLVVGVHRHDNYPTPQPDALVLASGLEAVSGEGLSRVSAVPPFGRLWLAILLGRRGDDAGALNAFDSMSDEQLVALPRETAVMTIAHLIADVPPTAVPAIRRYATATDEEAEWCLDLLGACSGSSAPAEAAADVVEFAEAALASASSPVGQLRALEALMWAQSRCGNPERAAEVGRLWLQRLESEAVAPARLAGIRLRLATALLDCEQVQSAVRELWAVIEDGPQQAVDVASERLVALAQRHPEIGEVPARIPLLYHVSPEAVSLTYQTEHGAAGWVTVVGDRGLLVTSATCTLTPHVSVRRMETERADDRWIVEIRLQGRGDTPREEGTITITTNAPARRTVELPVLVGARRH